MNVEVKDLKYFIVHCTQMQLTWIFSPDLRLKVILTFGFMYKIPLIYSTDYNECEDNNVCNGNTEVCINTYGGYYCLDDVECE